MKSALTKTKWLNVLSSDNIALMAKYIHRPKIINVFKRLTEPRGTEKIDSISESISNVQPQIKNVDLIISNCK